MATHFVFGNAPTVNNLLNYRGIDSKTSDLIIVESAEGKDGHYLLKINERIVGVQTDRTNIIRAVYTVNCDEEAVRLITILIGLWSEENSLEEEDIASTIIDEEMSIYLEYS
jgi:hypothetical protein